MALRGPNPSLPQFTAAKAAQFTAGSGAAAQLTATPVYAEAGGVGLAYLQADPANTGTIKLGDATSQYVTLSAGDWFPFAVTLSDLSLLYAYGSAASQKLNALIFQ